MIKLEDKTDLNYQMGLLLGELILNKYLPTLSVDGLRTNNIINVSEEEQQQYEKMDNLWFNQTFKKDKTEFEKFTDTKLFEEVKKFRYSLANKYLPKHLECIINTITPTNIDLLKVGVEDVLWDSDLSWYDTPKDNDLFFKPSEGWYCTITLILRTNES
jgi:hypothetical protein